MKAGWRQKILFLERQNMRIEDRYTGMSGQGRKQSRISLDGQEFYYSTRAENLASRALALSCGLTYQHSERRTDQRSGKTYELEIYKKNLESIGVGYEAG